MKEVERNFSVRTSADEIVQFLLSSDYTPRLQKQLDKVSKIEPRPLEELNDGIKRRVFHYRAPTQLPRPLRRFKDKAPEHVSWEEVWDIDIGGTFISTEIIPDVPDHWHDLYENEGHIRLTDQSDGSTNVHMAIQFSLDAPTGFGLFLNRAVTSELDTIFDAHQTLIQNQFS